ncbi:LysR family transcriptional regulator [Viridibacillus sp. YIM B01967]|uniref:LysR family transcriptional regulator n=1 Tax=Viridibacillus soli TaxID=2798301 RepID=A0ABS1H503_9BACL|nr:LysR family transcriptional regulator [Viridibacillus soli]MBK3494232.1 LysR family transcriptional regulator [Viridibacillus soli]
MDYQWIRTFIVAAKTCNFRQTAEMLLMSQPNVTVHIHQLEQSLNTKLFKRKKNRVTLTESGRAFFSEAIKIQEQWESSLENFQLFKNGYREQIIVAMTPMMVETILPHVIYDYIKRYPEIDVSILVEESNQIEKMVEMGEAHIGISLIKPQNKTIQVTELLQDTLQFAVPIDAYDDETGIYLDIEHYFEQYPLFTHHHPTIWDPLLIRLQKEFSTMKSIRVTQSYVVKRFIQDGLGISFMPKSILYKEHMEGRINMIDFPVLKLPSIEVLILSKQLREIDHQLVSMIKSRYYS